MLQYTAGSAKRSVINALALSQEQDCKSSAKAHMDDAYTENCDFLSVSHGQVSNLITQTQLKLNFNNSASKERLFVYIL